MGFCVQPPAGLQDHVALLRAFAARHGVKHTAAGSEPRFGLITSTRARPRFSSCRWPPREGVAAHNTTFKFCWRRRLASCRYWWFSCAVHADNVKMTRGSLPPLPLLCAQIVLYPICGLQNSCCCDMRVDFAFQLRVSDTRFAIHFFLLQSGRNFTVVLTPKIRGQKRPLPR